MADEQLKGPDADAAKRDFIEQQMARYQQGYRKLVVLGVYLGFFGLVASVVGLIIGLLASNWWVCWLGVGAVILAVFAVLAGMMGFTQNANNALLSMWTPIQHIEDGGAVQIKRMEDGYFVVLSVGVTHLNIYVTPKMGDLARTVEVASFGLNSAAARMAMSRNDRRAEDEHLLNQMRELVGFPKSVEEVRIAAEKLSQSIT